MTLHTYIITFFLYYFFNYKLCFICLLQLSFIKESNNFFIIKILYYIYPWYCIVNFFNQINFFRLIWSVTFCKNNFIFLYSNMIADFKFRIFTIFYIKVSIYVHLHINKLHFDCFMICTIVFINYPI